MGSRKVSFDEGVIVGVLLGPLKLAFTMLVCAAAILVLAWTVDGIFVFRVWPEGIQRLNDVLATDLAHAVELAQRQGYAPGVIVGTANVLYGAVFAATGIHDMGLRFAEGTALSMPDTVLRNAYVANRDVIEVAMIGTQLLGVRVAMLALMGPLLALVYMVAATDGLAQRAIRRASGGRESASLYHRAKHLQVELGGIAILAALTWPKRVDWMLAGVLVTVVLGPLARMQWAYYKKHLQ